MDKAHYMALVPLFISYVVISVGKMLLYNRLFALTFDENFAKATGIATDRYGLLIAVITAVIIVLGMNLVGSLLVSALVIFPAISAMQVYKSFREVTIASAVIAVLSAIVGMIVAILKGTPVGSTIVVADVAVFVIMSLIQRIKRK